MTLGSRSEEASDFPGQWHYWEEQAHAGGPRPSARNTAHCLKSSGSRWLRGLSMEGEGLGQGRQPASGWGVVPSDLQVLRLRSLGLASVSPSSPHLYIHAEEGLGLVSPSPSPHWAPCVCQVGTRLTHEPPNLSFESCCGEACVLSRCSKITFP